MKNILLQYHINPGGAVLCSTADKPKSTLNITENKMLEGVRSIGIRYEIRNEFMKLGGLYFGLAGSALWWRHHLSSPVTVVSG